MAKEQPCFEPDKEPSTHAVHGGSGAGHAAPKDGELGNLESTGKNPPQKPFDN
jgi:hypothetical protein